MMEIPMSSWWIAGYDLRKSHDSSAHIRELSVDPCVWPSVLEEICSARNLLEIYEQNSNWVGLLRSPKTLFELIPDAATLGVIVEISYPKDAIFTLSGFLGVCKDPIDMDEIVTLRKCLLGFDVSDPRTLTSAIHLKHGETRIFENELHGICNGLLKSLDVADKLTAIATRMIPEHAPFYITKLMQLCPIRQE